MKKYLLILLIASPFAFAQTAVNPSTQIKWPQSTGSGSPIAGCGSPNYGAPYTDISNNIPYTCTPGGWVQQATIAPNVGINIQGNPLSEQLPNNTASGTTLNKLVCGANVSGTLMAQTCTTASTMWTGVAVGGATGVASGNTIIARAGQTSCIFDGTTVIGDYVQISSTVAGDCHDTGSTYPTTAAVVGRVVTVNSGTGTTALLNLFSPGIISNTGAGGNVSGQTVNCLPKASGSTALTAPSSVCDNGTSVTGSEPFTATQVAGTSIASQNQTSPGSNNGIANAFTNGAAVVTADPGYSNTVEKFEVVSNAVPISQAQSQTQLNDQRNPGILNHICHDPSINVLDSLSACWNLVTNVTATQSGLGRQAGLSVYGFHTQPGVDLGTPGVGPGNWTNGTAMVARINASAPGIHQIIGGVLMKPGIGDNDLMELYGSYYGGAVAGSDEGHHFQGGVSGEATVTFTGTVSTGGASATTVKTNCTADCSNLGFGPLGGAGPGDGRFLVDTTTVDSGNITGACTGPTATTAGSCPIDHTITASYAVGTLNGACNTGAVPTPLGTGYNTVTCSVNVTSGTFDTSGLLCFVGQFHEQTRATNVTGAGPVSITMPLRHAHQTASQVYEGGACGQYLNITANNQTPGSQVIHWPRDIAGSDATHIFYNGFWTGTNQLPLDGNFYAQTFSATTLNNAGGVVYFSSSVNISQHPELIGNTVQFSSSAVSAYNGACTNLQWRITTSGGTLFNCVQAGSVGAGTSATATYSVGTSQYGSTAYTTWNGAETLDVLDHTLTPPAVFNSSNQVTFTLEPNAAAWTTSDPVEQAHHYAATFVPFRYSGSINNPETHIYNGYQIGFGGAGFSGGNLVAPYNGAAAFTIENNQSIGVYVGHGGTKVPPGGFVLGSNGGSHLFNWGYSMEEPPEPLGSTAFFVGCGTSGVVICNDPNFWYYALGAAFTTGGSESGIRFTPLQNEWYTIGNWVWNSDFGKQTIRDTFAFASLVTPTLNAPTCPGVGCPTTGGSLLDSTVYRYTVYALNNTGNGVQSNEQTITTSNSGGNTNSVVLTWTRSAGAIGYRVCRTAAGGGTGTELQIVSLTTNTQLGSDFTTWTDNGTLTPSGSCPTTDSSLPGFTGALSGSFNSSGTAFNMTLKAPAGAATNYTVTGPETVTTGSLVDKLAGATTIGDAACFSNITGRIQDCGAVATKVGSISVAAARKGTFVCTSGGTITISNTNELVTSDVVISLNTAGGTISTPPAMKTVTSGTGFTVLCAASDTSTYNYDILN